MPVEVPAEAAWALSQAATDSVGWAYADAQTCNSGHVIITAQAKHIIQMQKPNTGFDVFCSSCRRGGSCSCRCQPTPQPPLPQPPPPPRPPTTNLDREWAASHMLAACSDFQHIQAGCCWCGVCAAEAAVRLACNVHRCSSDGVAANQTGLQVKQQQRAWVTAP